MSTAQRRVININAAGGALVLVAATAGSRKVVIQECPPAAGVWNGANWNAQGLNYTLPDDAFVTIYPLLPDDPLVFDNPIAQGAGGGSLQGGPAQSDPAGRTIAARVYCKLVSAALATQVLVIEYS